MEEQKTTVKHQQTGNKSKISKVSKEVLYICLEEGCGATFTNKLKANNYRGPYTGNVLCPDCFIVMHKVIK